MASFNTAKVKTVCENKLKIKFRVRKECNGWVYLEDKKFARITIPKGKKNIPPKTYKTMARQLKLNVNEFDMLISCTMSGTDYIRKHTIR